MIICLVRAWFKLGEGEKTKWKKNIKTKNVICIKKDEESLEEFVRTLKPKLGKKTGFRNFMGKMKTTFNSILRRRKRIKLTRKGNTTLVAAEWVDQELIDSIKLRSRWSREWRDIWNRRR